MGQVLTRDLGLSASEEEEYKIAMAQQIVKETMKKQQREAEDGINGLEKSCTEGESGLGESELEEECIDDDDDEEGDGHVIGEDDEDISAEDSFHKKGMKEFGFEKKQQNQVQDEQENGQNVYESKQKNVNQFKRPFESIKVNEYFGQSEDDNDENEMLGDMSDEQEEYEQSDKEREEDHQQHALKSKKRTHNIRDDADPQLLNGSNQKADSQFENDSSQIKFHHAFESPPSESEESSQFGPVFTDSDVAEDEDQDMQRQQQLPSTIKNNSIKIISDKSSIKPIGGQGGLRKEESLSQKGIDTKSAVGSVKNKKDALVSTPSQKDAQNIKSANNNNRLSEGRLSNQGSAKNINNNYMVSSIEKRNNSLGIPVPPNRFSSSKKSLSRDGSLQIQGNAQDQYAKYRAQFFPDQAEKK